ncbi:MAG: hypothetical protein IJH64_06565 [Oscillospiraceae bacterium]|nr:hypothetical protein [Oscillospiraceae bacterium]MBR0450886.1 hypothetical protein [Oscillospiraceae bacterium]
MAHKLRLGPIAVFLTVVAIILTTLATLTIATSRADTVLAERFATMTAIRYSLEKEGNEFLYEVTQKLESGASLNSISDLNRTGDGLYEYKAEKDGYELKIRLAPQGPDSFSIEEWKITKIWNEEELSQDIWLG